MSRRALLASASSAAVGAAYEKGSLLPAELKRYADPATEFGVVRLTDPSHESWLPAYYGRILSHRGDFLLYASDRSGSMQGYRMDLKNGQSREVANDNGLMPASLTLMPDEKNVCYVAGKLLQMASLANARVRQIYEIPAGFEAGDGFSVSDDGLYGLLVERRADRYRLRLITMRTGAAATIVDTGDRLSEPMPRPRRAGVLYRRDNDLWLVNFDGAQNRRLKVEPGSTGPGMWSPDGREVLYLNFPADKKQLNNLRECTPDTNEDRLIARTSQFVNFGRNSDASVLVGASASKASPYVLLLVRSVRRELTLCEHRASDPSRVSPIFSPNSQRIFFQSDRDGKMAIYSMNVERLVAETEIE